MRGLDVLASRCRASLDWLHQTSTPSLKERPYRRGGWEVDIRVVAPDGVRQIRERKHAPVSSRTEALRWGQARERELFERLINPARAARKEPPTLREFAPQFMEGHARANRQKPSSIRAKDMALRVYLLPMFGRRKLDAITSADVQHLKAQLQTKAPKTVNNVLAVLSVMLKKAVEWDLIERMPCTIKLLPVPKGVATFHDFDAFERLVNAARKLDPRTHVIVLLGGEAGLRCGEILALEWSDIDLANRRLTVARSDWDGQVTAPKSGRVRHVPLTRRLAAALAEHRHLRSPRVLCQDDNQPLTRQIVQTRVKRASRVANLNHTGVHVLRHTFCSHLAMRGAPGRAIQELAGHQDLAMTQRYMHLSPVALDDAISLLDQPVRRRPASAAHSGCGDILATEGGQQK